MTTPRRPPAVVWALDAALFAPLWADPQRTGVFLDLDGVLAPIAPRPELAAVPPATAALVRRLVDAVGLVAIVSGRSVVDARRMLAIPRLMMIGNHGGEVFVPEGAGPEGAGCVPDATTVDGVGDQVRRDELAAQVERAACDLETDPELMAVGARLERKGLSVALHTRGSGERAAAVAAAAAAAAGARHGLEVLPGRAVVDLRIPGCTKGSAVLRLTRAAGLTAALYIGDDATDLDAFVALDGLRREEGVATVKVGVISEDGPAELARMADLMIEFADVPVMLAGLADEVERRRNRAGHEEAR